jgi:hypothetical protein
VVLAFMSGPRDGETVTVTASGVPGRILIGRAVPPEGVSLPWDPDASRTHASLTARDGAWWLEDAGSRNGTFVGEFADAARVTAAVRLAPGQVFRCGLTRLRIEGAGANAVAAMNRAERSL